MRRLLLLLVLAAACDPDLTVRKDDAGAPPDASRPDAGSPNDAGTTPSDASSTDGSTDDAGGGDGGQTTHLVDGVNDFTPQETFNTTSTTPNPYRAFVTWDATRLYFGMDGIDVGAGASATKWVLVYLEGQNGTTTGIAYGAQQPTLPFSARYHLRWKTNKTYTNAQEWTGAAWTDASATIPIVAASTGNFMEMSITRAAIGNPTTIKVHMSMINEATGADWTYAGLPGTSFVDGPNRMYTKYFDFDLTSPQAPNAYTPLP